MKKQLSLLCLIISYITLNAQHIQPNVYQIEEHGYYINFKPALNGYVFTDNYCNSLYYLENGELQELVSSPGCGRYFTVSPDGSKVGFKNITKKGQTPVYISLEDKELHFLDEESKLCGQVGFTKNSVFFTKGDWLYGNINDTASIKVKLGNYSNIADVSDGYNNIVFSTPNDELILKYSIFDLHQTLTISEPGKMSIYPQFSPDNKKIMYQSGEIYVYELETGKTYNLGNGIAPKWSPDSETIVFVKQNSENQNLIKSDIFTCNYKNGIHTKISISDDILAMEPVFINEIEILYSTYSSLSLRKFNLQTKEDTEIHKFKEAPEITFFNISKAKSESLIPGTVPYTHQVYDTHDDHYGHGSCAPTCAIMAISYYNIVPKWPMIVTKIASHTSDYGAYVSQRYRLNEFYFEESENTSGGDLAFGGYGYMWGLGSPNSQMRNYMEYHYMESSQLWSSSVTWDAVIAEIDADYPLPMCAMLSSSGHLVLAKGYIDNQHTLIFSEPYGDKNTPDWPSYDGQKVYYDWPGYNNGYQNLDYNGTYGIIAWTVTAHTSESEYNDTIIDDIYYNHGFVMNNSEDGSTQRYYRDINGGYNNHFWYTITEASSDDICWVEWIPTLENHGYYEVSAYIPSTYADAENAPYKITDAEGLHIVEINQGDYSDEWVDLGAYRFDETSEFKVHLGDGTGTASQNIAFDAVKFEYIPAPIAAFTISEEDFCVGESIVFTNTSTNAENYEWTFPGATTTSSTDENPAITYSEAGIYDISLTANGSVESDILEETSYITIHGLPVADFSINSDHVYLPDAIVLFSNLSTDAQNYLWDFGDGNNSTDTNPYHEYTAIGNYTVSLTANNPWCTDNDFFEYESEIVVLNPTRLIEFDNKKIAIYPNPTTNYLNIITNDELQKVSIFDTKGALILQKLDSKTRINIQDLPKDTYLIEVETENSTFNGKFVKG